MLHLSKDKNEIKIKEGHSLIQNQHLLNAKSNIESKMRRINNIDVEYTDNQHLIR